MIKINAGLRLLAAPKVELSQIRKFVRDAYDRSMQDDSDVDEHEFAAQAFDLWQKLKGSAATKAPSQLWRLASLTSGDALALKAGRNIYSDSAITSYSSANMEVPKIADEAFKRFGFRDSPCTIIVRVENRNVWRMLNIPVLYKMCGRVNGVDASDIAAEKEILVLKGMTTPPLSGENVVAYREYDKPWIFRGHR